MVPIPALPLPLRTGDQRGQMERKEPGGWAGPQGMPSPSPPSPSFSMHPGENGSRVIFARFPPLLESPQPQIQEGLWFPLPSPGSLVSTQTGAPLHPPEEPKGCSLPGGRELSTSCCRRSQVGPFPSRLPDTPLFQAGKVANEHPFPNTPPCAPIPLRESKRRHTI